MFAANNKKAAYGLEVIGSRHINRPQVEQYIRHRYQSAFNATVNEFMPYLVVLTDPQGAVCAVCGYRPAANAHLFLEQYLTSPAETLLSNALGTPIPRHQLVEIGQLASFSSGVSRFHFSIMAQLLVSQGFFWCVFTATGPLYALMRRLGLKPTVIQQASERNVASCSDWGSYYETMPCVMGGAIAQGLNALPNVEFSVEGDK